MNTAMTQASIRDDFYMWWGFAKFAGRTYDCRAIR